MANQHRKRPRDFSQAAKLVIDIATGQVEDRPPTPEERGKDPAAARWRSRSEQQLRGPLTASSTVSGTKISRQAACAPINTA